MLEQYEVRLPIIREVAKSHGYAIAFHGSGIRDFDLVAVPWIDPISDAATLVEAIRVAVDGVILPYDNTDKPQSEWRNPAVRPHGRLAWSIQIGGDRYIDLSVYVPTEGK